MERFKVCEKETKTKTFSKEGLAQAQKQDPKEKARNEARDWINSTVDTLTAEVRPPFASSSLVCVTYCRIQASANGTQCCTLILGFGGALEQD